jgi:arylformamidase
MVMGTHCGTHFDAPLHFVPNGKRLADIPLETFIGNARLIDVSAETKTVRTVTADMLRKAGKIHHKIVLIKTNNSYDFIRNDDFEFGFTTLSGEAADYLARCGVKAVGFDYLTVDPADAPADLFSKAAHQALLGRGICIIEGLDLSEPGDGVYFAVCLPLKLGDTDGAPGRAILIGDK